jgi:hypothetical protein
MKLSAHFLVKGQDYRKVYIFKDIVAANVREVDTHVIFDIIALKRRIKVFGVP